MPGVHQEGQQTNTQKQQQKLPATFAERVASSAGRGADKGNGRTWGESGSSGGGGGGGGGSPSNGSNGDTVASTEMGAGDGGVVADGTAESGQRAKVMVSTPSATVIVTPPDDDAEQSEERTRVGASSSATSASATVHRDAKQQTPAAPAAAPVPPPPAADSNAEAAPANSNAGSEPTPVFTPDTTVPRSRPSEPEEDLVKRRVFVGNLPKNCTEVRLVEFLGTRFGKMVDVNIVIERDSHSSRGYGFVTFATEPQAKACIKEKTAMFGGRHINFGPAKRQPRKQGAGASHQQKDSGSGRRSAWTGANRGRDTPPGRTSSSSRQQPHYQRVAASAAPFFMVNSGYGMQDASQGGYATAFPWYTNPGTVALPMDAQQFQQYQLQQHLQLQQLQLQMQLQQQQQQPQQQYQQQQPQQHQQQQQQQQPQQPPQQQQLLQPPVSPLLGPGPMYAGQMAQFVGGPLGEVQMVPAGGAYYSSGSMSPTSPMLFASPPGQGMWQVQGGQVFAYPQGLTIQQDGGVVQPSDVDGAADGGGELQEASLLQGGGNAPAVPLPLAAAITQSDPATALASMQQLSVQGKGDWEALQQPASQ